MVFSEIIIPTIQVTDDLFLIDGKEIISIKHLSETLVNQIEKEKKKLNN